MARRAIFCFVHIEKAAGMTLHALLRNNFPFSYVTVTPWYLWSNEAGAELTAEEVRGLARALPNLRGFGGHTTRSYCGYADALGRPVRYFTFLREPIARYVSHYRHQVHAMKKGWTLDTFLNERRFDDYMTVRLAGRPDVEQAKRQLRKAFCCVGLMERFDESLLLLRGALGYPKMDLRYQRENESRAPGGASESLEDASVQERLRRANRLDLELYRFARDELYPAQVAAYGAGLSADLSALQAANRGYRFPAWRRAAWTAYRRLVTRPIESWLHRRAERRRPAASNGGGAS